MKNWKKSAAAILFLLLVGSFFGWRVVRRGSRARDIPSKLCGNPKQNRRRASLHDLQRNSPEWHARIRRKGSERCGLHLELVRFIRHLPSLTTEEEKQMESLNPKSPMEMGEENQEAEFLKAERARTAISPS
jgi:hypothetical protein